MPLADFANEYSELIQRLLRIRASGRAGHAYLFTGDDGDLLEAFALAWLESFACHSPAADGDACGKCPACKQFKAGSYSGLSHLRPESKSRQIVVDQVRDFEHQLYLTGGAHTVKAGLVSDAECLNAQAQNALLKTLEEPPAGTIIILLSTSPKRLLPTIRSRCQTVSLTRNRRDYALAMQLGLFPALALLDDSGRGGGAAAAFKAAGRIRKALGTLQDKAAEIVAGMDDAELNDFIEQDSSLAKRMGEIREARTAAEYRKLRTELLETIHDWFCQKVLLAADVPPESLPYPEMIEAAGVTVEQVRPADFAKAEALADKAAVLVRQLQGNMDETLAVDSFCFSASSNSGS